MHTDKDAKGHIQQIREHDGIFKRRSNPNQVQWILVDRDNLGQRCRVRVADVRSSSRGLDADSKIPHPNLHRCSSHDVRCCRDHTRVHLRKVEGRLVSFVVHRNEEDVGDLR